MIRTCPRCRALGFAPMARTPKTPRGQRGTTTSSRPWRSIPSQPSHASSGTVGGRARRLPPSVVWLLVAATKATLARSTGRSAVCVSMRAAGVADARVAFRHLRPAWRQRCGSHASLCADADRNEAVVIIRFEPRRCMRRAPTIARRRRCPPLRWHPVVKGRIVATAVRTPAQCDEMSPVVETGTQTGSSPSTPGVGNQINTVEGMQTSSWAIAATFRGAEPCGRAPDGRDGYRGA